MQILLKEMHKEQTVSRKKSNIFILFGIISEHFDNIPHFPG